MTIGADHYRQAEQLVDEAAKQTQPEAARMLYAVALVHATLAQAAATALRAMRPGVGESPEAADWARLIQPGHIEPEPVVEADIYPAGWPPKPGGIWQDRDGDRWMCLGTGYLANLAGMGDDSADEIWHEYGPMHLIFQIEPTGDKVPF